MQLPVIGQIDLQRRGAGVGPPGYLAQLHARLVLAAFGTAGVAVLAAGLAIIRIGRPSAQPPATAALVVFIATTYIPSAVGLAPGRMSWTHLTPQNSPLSRQTIHAPLAEPDGRMVIGADQGTTNSVSRRMAALNAAVFFGQ